LWTALPERAPTLVAWAGGPRAARLAALSREAIVGRAVAAVAEIFPRARAAERLESAHFHDWSADPFARGAYSYVTVGGRTARRRLAAPLDGTLFFAGEATDDESAATVEGALRSGERAARDVLGHLHARR
jgi:monoamine oxidase